LRRRTCWQVACSFKPDAPNEPLGSNNGARSQLISKLLSSRLMELNGSVRVSGSTHLLRGTNMTAKSKEKQVVAEVAMDNVIDVLHADHLTVADLFFQFSQAKDNAEKEELVATIISELATHAKVEEEIVYPIIREADEENEDIMDEADTEHHVIKFLLSELSSMKADEDFYDSKVTVLCELVNHHVQEEEKEVFEKLEKSGADLEELGSALLARKEELTNGRKPSVKNSMAENSKEISEAKAKTKKSPKGKGKAD
jgi:hemerythrin superfamily protein